MVGTGVARSLTQSALTLRNWIPAHSWRAELTYANNKRTSRTNTRVGSAWWPRTDRMT